MKGSVWGVWMFLSVCFAWGWRAFRQQGLARGFEFVDAGAMTTADLCCVLEQLPTREFTKPSGRLRAEAQEAQRNRQMKPRAGVAEVETRPKQSVLPIDVNRLDSAGWDALPWVGARTAQRIVRFREALGGFVDLDQIQTVYHIHDSAVAIVKRRGFIDTTAITTICIDTASWVTMVRHPCIDRGLASLIERYRTQHVLERVDDLLGSQAIDDSSLRAARPYLEICGRSGEGF